MLLKPSGVIAMVVPKDTLRHDGACDDVRGWVFTPGRFRLIPHDLKLLSLVSPDEYAMHQLGSLKFYVGLATGGRVMVWIGWRYAGRCCANSVIWRVNCWGRSLPLTANQRTAPRRSGFSVELPRKMVAFGCN